jgi:large subunit ribosomal protein L18
MYHVTLRRNNRIRRKLKIRNTISGTQEKPRLSVFRSNKHIFAQLIDDVKGVTLVSVSDSKTNSKKPKVESAFEAGKQLAKLAVEKKIKDVVFDRNGYRYHGRVKSIADGVFRHRWAPE